MIEPAGIDGPTYLSVGSVLKGRYEIQKEIGRGGYSVVYAARDRELDSQVAVKLLVPPPADAHIARERMRREVLAARGLSHPNIVAVYDFLEEDQRSFVVMEYVPGSDLSLRLKESGPLDVEEVVSIGRGIAAALSAAHERGILHRDVKPQNILVARNAQPRLTDFGSARLEGHSTLTRTGGLVGTLTYAAPELVAGERGDGRSDIYALGMTLYFCLTGRLPNGPSPHLPPPPTKGGYRPRAARAEVPVWLDEVIATATAADPSDRFPTATTFAEALENRGAPANGAGRPETRNTCLICGAAEPLGLAVCPRCGGVPSGSTQALIFTRRPMYKGDREVVAAGLKALLGDRAQAAELEDVAAGHRALVQVPAPSAESVVEQLRARQIPARAARLGRAWAPLPLRFYGLLALVVGAGGTAGLSAMPALIWTSPMAALLLLLLAQRRLQKPVVALPERKSQLPAKLEHTVIEAFALLPAGTARSLLADVVRLGQRLHANMSRSRNQAEEISQLEQLLAYSCAAAIDLWDLEEALSRFADQRERSHALSDEWLDGLSLCERRRDRMVQRFLEVITLLGRARGHSALLGQNGERLDELAREIERHCEVHAEAAREIEALLEGEA